MSKDVLAVASDHAGVEMKALVKGELEAMGFAVTDLGTHGTNSVDYPDFADAMAAEIKAGKALKGVLICGTGIGISMAANRHRHIRAAVCHDAASARLSRAHNNANVLALGARLLGPETVRDCVRTFFTTAFEGDRHQRRVDKMS